MDAAANVQCIQISAQTFLVAVPDGRSWVTNYGSHIVPLPASDVAAKLGSLAATAVEGAISAGLINTEHSITPRPFTMPRYIRWLAGNYVFAGQTPGLLRRGAERLEALGRVNLAEFARKKAEEEDGHADLAYRDLEGLGLPAAEVIRVVRPPSADAFADRFRAYVESDDPIALFGFSYCLERMAVGRDDAFVEKIQAICPRERRAIRFLKVHSNTGSDSDHVHEQLALFESFDDAELASVVRAAFETAQMLAKQPLLDRVLTDDEIHRRLRRIGIDISCARADASDADQSRSAAERKWV
jgi:hypothetical protein